MQNKPSFPAWQAGFPKGLQGHEAFKDFGKVGDLGNKYLELMTRSQRALYLPSDESNEDERTAFLRKLGHPETPDAYELPEVPKGLQLSQEQIAQAKAQAHRLGFTTKQFKALMADQLTSMEKAQAARAVAQKKAIEDQDKGLREEWKDGYETNKELALRSYNQFVDEATAKQLSDSGLTNQPWFIRMMHKIGAATAEGSFIRSQGGGSSKKNYLTDYKSE
jgi:hypothetical protein